MRASISLCFLFVAACTFPTVNLADDAGDVGPLRDTSQADSAADDTNGSNDAVAEASADSTTGDTGANPGDTSNCDFDHDGFKVATCNPAPLPKMADCNDHSDKVRPDINSFVILDPTTESPSTWTLVGDWNCDGRVDKQFKTVGAKCENRLVTDCPQTEYFQGAGNCGEGGALVTCKGGLSCTTASSTPATQGCL